MYLVGCGAGGIDGVNRSEDGGKTWKIIGLRGQDVQAITFDSNNPNVLYAGSDRTVYKSRPGGTSWTELGVLDTQIRSITPDPSFSGIVYVATDRGVYIYKASGDVTPPATPKDVQAELQDTTATINWSANTENDLAGYKVYYGTSPGAGRAVYWDGRNEAGERVASGVYLYVMEAGHFRATKRMTVLK